MSCTFSHRELSLSLTLAASYANLSIFSSKSLNLDDSSAMSSAKSRSSSTVVNFHLIPLLLSVVAVLMTQSKHSKNSKTDITHPCFTPDLIINQSANNCALKTSPYAHYHSHHVAWYPIASHDIPYSLSLCTASKAFSKSTKSAYRPSFHSFACSKIKT